MKYVWFFLSVMASTLFAAEVAAPVVAAKAEFVYPDFSQCYEKNKASVVYFGTTRAVAISEKYAIAYSKEKPTHPFIKHDYLSHLYLFESAKPLTPIKLKSTSELKLGEWLASMTDTSLNVLNAAKVGTSNTFFELGGAGEPSSIVGGLCCEMYGLGVGEKYFIGSEALNRFIEGKVASYSDLGARFVENNESIVVDAIDMTPGKTKLKVGDKISSLNGKKVKTLNEFHDAFMLGKSSSKLSAQIERNNAWVEENILILPPKPKVVKKVEPKKESYLQTKGFKLTPDMKIIGPSYASLAEKSGLKEGDRLIQIDDVRVEKIAEADAYLEKSKNKEISLLFERNDFQFFVTLKR